MGINIGVMVFILYKQLGLARYTDVTVRYVPRFRGHCSIRFRYNREKKTNLLYVRFLFIYFEQTVVQIKKKFHLDVNILILLHCYI